MHHKAGRSVEAGKMARMKASWIVNESDDATMIECESCHCFGFGRLEYPEAEALLCMGSISRACPRCGETTRWRQVDIHTVAGKHKGKGIRLPEIQRRSSKQLLH